MLLEALDRAGWVGEIVSSRATVSLRVGVAAVPAERPKQRVRREPLPGRVRRLGASKAGSTLRALHGSGTSVP